MLTRSTWICYFLMTLACPIARADLAVVWSEEVDLYRNTLLTRVLPFGDVVPVKEDKTDPEWLKVKVDGIVYSARKKYFRTQHQLAFDFDRKKTTLENEQVNMAHSIEANAIRKDHLYSCILQIEWDRTIFFRIPIADPVVTTANPSPHQSNLPQYRRVEKISSSKARRLKQKWDNELDYLEEEDSRLLHQRLSIIKKLVSKQSTFHHLNSLLKRYSEFPKTYRNNHYIVAEPYAALFDGTNRVAELRKGDIAIGTPNRDDTSRLRILHKGRWYDSSAAPYQSRAEIEARHSLFMAHIHQKMSDKTEEIRALRSRETLYHSYIDDLQWASRTSKEFAVVHHTPDYARGRFSSTEYRVEFPPDCTEVISRVRARRTIRKWKRELDTLKLEIEERSTSLEQLEEELASHNASYSKLLRRFDAVRNSRFFP